MAMMPEQAGPATNVTVQLAASLCAYCGAAPRLSIAAGSVRALLQQLERGHPALYRSVCDETGAVRRHVNVFVNSEHMRDRQGLDTPLVSGDVVTILPAVSGG